MPREPRIAMCNGLMWGEDNSQKSFVCWRSQHLTSSGFRKKTATLSVRVLFVTSDKLSQRRAGPGVRAIELARVLARDHEVTVATAQPSDTQFTDFALLDNAQQRTAELKKLARASDIVITQGMVLAQFSFLKRARHLVVDLYD